MKRSGRRYFLRLSLLGTAALIGCLGKTPAAVYYTLSPLESAAAIGAAAPVGELAIGIGPVKFPDELDRPAIVTRSGANRLEVNEFRRWGGSLEKNVIRVLEENLSHLLGTDRVMARPWEGHFRPDVRLALDFRRFDGRLGDYAALHVTWMLIASGDDAPPLVRRTIVQEAVSDDGYDALVAAQSRALGRLSQEIALVLSQRRGDR